MFLTCGNKATPRWAEWATMFTVTLADTLSTPVTPLAAAIKAVRNAGIWLLAG
jgi:hypothetical protein